MFLAFGHLFGGRNAFSLPLGHNAVFHMAFVKPLFARKRPWPSHGFACPERVFIFHGCRVWMLLVFKNRKKRKMHSRPARGSEKRRRILCSSMPLASTGGGPCPLHGLLLASSTHHSCPDCVRFLQELVRRACAHCCCRFSALSLVLAAAPPFLSFFEPSASRDARTQHLIFVSTLFV